MPITRLYSCGKIFDELRLGAGPVFQNPGSAGAAGQVAVAFEQAADAVHVFGGGQRLKIDAGQIARLVEKSPLSS